MALVRILVDGYNLIHALQQCKEFGCNQSYSLLHTWPDLAPGAPRHSERARDALVETLQLYQDACGTPVTVFFDGQGPKRGRPTAAGGHAVEVLFSSAGQTADDLIERAAHRFQPYGEVMVVTDDYAERDTVSAFGGLVASCGNFIRMVDQTLAEMQDSLRRHNRTDRNAYRRPR